MTFACISLEVIVTKPFENKGARKNASGKNAPRKNAPEKSAPRKITPENKPPRKIAPRKIAPRKNAPPPPKKSILLSFFMLWNILAVKTSLILIFVSLNFRGL